LAGPVFAKNYAGIASADLVVCIPDLQDVHLISLS